MMSGLLRSGVGIDQEEPLAVLDGLGAFRQDFGDAPIHFRLDLVH